MSFLDDQKRARRGAKALARLLTDTKNFESNLDAYTAADGIIDQDFLQHLDAARPLLKKIGEPDFPARIQALTPPFQEAFLEYLIENERVDVLARVRDESKDKNLAKSARQHLHTLKMRGVSVPATAKRGWRRGGPAESGELPCVVTAFDSHGERLILIGREVSQGARLVRVVESDRDGVAGVASSIETRAKAKALVADMREKLPDRVLDIAPEVAAYLINVARERTQARGLSLPPGFVTAMSYLRGVGELPERHPFFEDVRPMELEFPEKRLADSGKIFDHPLAKTWIIGPIELKTFERELHGVLGGPGDAAGREAQARRLIAESVDRYFSRAEVREGFATRLLNFAWFCRESGDDDVAMLAYAVSATLPDLAARPSSIPFCFNLLGRFVMGPGGDEVEKREPLILL
ncbi:hypothetical protein K8I61_19975 [bacterium]|nr:hypothetical protein [bacterium]